MTKREMRYTTDRESTQTNEQTIKQSIERARVPSARRRQHHRHRHRRRRHRVTHACMHENGIGFSRGLGPRSSRLANGTTDTTLRSIYYVVYIVYWHRLRSIGHRRRGSRCPNLG